MYTSCGRMDLTRHVSFSSFPSFPSFLSFLIVPSCSLSSLFHSFSSHFFPLQALSRIRCVQIHSPYQLSEFIDGLSKTMSMQQQQRDAFSASSAYHPNNNGNNREMCRGGSGLSSSIGGASSRRIGLVIIDSIPALLGPMLSSSTAQGEVC